MNKIEKRNIEDILALTPMQEGMLFHFLKNPHNDLYFEQLSLSISGEIHLPFFKKAWENVVENNGTLRTVFRWEGVKRAAQIVLKHLKPRVEIVEFPGKAENPGQWKEWLETLKIKNVKRQFDLREVPFGITLCKINESKYELILSCHHILYDGWSNGIILEEFFDAYNQGCENGEIKSKSPRGKAAFKEYVQWIQNRDLKKQETFWRDYLKGLNTRTGFPSLRKRVKEGDRNIPDTADYTAVIAGETGERLDDFVKNFKITPAGLFYTAWGVLLQRYANSKDVIFGTTVSGRSARIKGIEKIVGLFINTLPIRVKTVPGETAGLLLRRVHNELQSREEYETASLTDVKEYSELDNAGEIFDSIMVVDNYPLDTVLLQSSGRITVDSYSMVERSHYDLTVGIVFLQDIKVKFNYKPERFDEEAVVRLFGHFNNLLLRMVSEPGKPVSQLDMLTEEEKHRLVVEFNDTFNRYPEDKTIHERFEQQVEKTPDAAALVFEENRFLTYKCLNRHADSLAFRLRAMGVKPGVVVGKIGEFSLETAAGLMAILKAGGAYAAISPDYPPQRVEYILKDCCANVLLTQIDFKERFPGVSFGGETIIIPREGEWSADIPGNITFPAHPAYILYTSGSTGAPKGVVVEHRAVNNLLSWFGETYALKPGTRVLQLTDYTFDPHVEDLFGTLLFGGTLHMVRKELLLNMNELQRYMERHQINLIDAVPTLLYELLCRGRRLPSLDTVITGGERLSEPLKNELLDRGYTLFNHYGLLETTVDALVSQCTKEVGASVFKPIANTAAYIVDLDNNLLPVGAVGELVLSGAQLARGYLNRPELTRKRFCLRRPGGSFEKLPPGPPQNVCLFKTGDLARWLPDGPAAQGPYNIELFGRTDHQVKINGFRIELGEIENRLISHKDIKDAVVTAVDDGGGKYLCGYIVPVPNPLDLDGRTYHIHTAAQAPHLEDKLEAVHAGSWPAFFIGSRVNRTYWKQLYTVFPGFQLVITEYSGNVAAGCNSIPIYWDGKKTGLPEGWDHAVLKAFETRTGVGNTPRPNTLCVLAGVVNKNFKSRGMSYQVITAMKRVARDKGLEHFIIPVRLTRKDRFPYMDLEEYCNKKREDGRPFDPWLRVHLRLGGEVLGYSRVSQRIEGTIKEWETWTGRLFEKSGSYVIEGAMQPVEIDVETDAGIYNDLAVWIRHTPAEKTAGPINLVDGNDIRDYLSTALPYYMVPARVVFLDRFPLTSTGKIDRNALSVPGIKAREEGFTGPRDEVERVLADIWADILGKERGKIGINDNFFLSGGHSLKATALVFHIQNAFHVDVPLQLIFKSPTLKGLADFIRSGEIRKVRYSALEPVEEKEYYPLSPGQKRMVVLDRMEEGGVTYNGAQMVVLEGTLDREKVEGVFRKLIRRHESLRTSIVLINDEPFQRVHREVDFSVEYFEPGPGGAQRLVDGFIRPFDLGRCPLLRVRLVGVGESKHILMVDMHHMVSDGTSQEIFIRDFLIFYENRSPAPLPVQYKDYSQWRNAGVETGKEREKFWSARFRDGCPVLDLPTDYERPGVRSFEGDMVSFTVPHRESEVLNALVREEEVTLFMVMCALFNIFFSRLSGQEDIVIGTPVGGRDHKDLDGVIGMFVNTLALRNFPVGEKTFRAFLRDVKERVLEAFENGDYPFESLVDRVVTERSPNRTPIFDVMVALEGLGTWDGEVPGLNVLLDHNYRFENRVSKFDLVYMVEVGGEELRVELEYSTELFKRETVESFNDYFKQIVSIVADNPDIKLQEIKITGDWSDRTVEVAPIDFDF